MAKRKRAQGPRLRRQCGAMAAHMLLLEQFPAFRANQMRLEGATAAAPRHARSTSPKWQVVTIKTVVNVVYNTDAAEHLGRADQQPDRRDEQGFPRDESRQDQDAGSLEGARHRLAHPVQAGEGHAHEDDAGPASRTTTG